MCLLPWQAYEADTSGRLVLLVTCQKTILQLQNYMYMTNKCIKTLKILQESEYQTHNEISSHINFFKVTKDSELEHMYNHW